MKCYNNCSPNRPDCHDNICTIDIREKALQNHNYRETVWTGCFMQMTVMTVFFAFDYKNLIKLRKPPVPGDPAQYREAVENPAIVHFQSCFRMSIRPWVEGCKHPYAKTYLAYKAKSPWKDTPMKPDDRTAPQKVLSAVTSAMPEGLMVDCISFVHTKIYPLARNLKQRMNRK